MGCGGGGGGGGELGDVGEEGGSEGERRGGVLGGEDRGGKGETVQCWLAW